MREDGHHCDNNECWCWNDRYQVVTREYLEDLHHAVNSFIHQKGWRPLGGVSVTFREGNALWAQAMVRYL